MLGLLKKVIDPNEREIRRLNGIVAQVNALEPEVLRLSDEELRAKTGAFRERIQQGATLDQLLPEAFAVAREAARRTLGMRPFDVQVMGAIVLHEGRIAEMKTGEGKTLVATMPVYLNALLGRGVHVVTVNEYLARRDAEWMGAIYRFLGLSVGVIAHDMGFEERKRAYACDVTYGTNNEFGFDYLRDNMVWDVSQMVQRELYYAIVDEVDSILIDEARTPLIISGMAEESTEHYYTMARLVPRLREGEDYTVDEKARTVALTEAGVAKVEKMLNVDNLYDDRHFELTHYLQQALRAHALFKRDRDYVVKDGQVIIVDEFTGRLMFGRRYSDGLHQAIEAKEGVQIQRESQTLATITFQNFFRMYKKLAGMTGTAATEEAEFQKIYGMDVVVIPTNKPMIRTDYPDAVYKTEKAKFDAVVTEIEELHKTGRPVLVGTVSIEKSERLSEMLTRRGIPHVVLNAKYHEKEAQIVAQAGKLGAVTIATNMAGRGTDIVLGGNPEYLARERLKARGFSDDEVAEAVERTRFAGGRLSRNGAGPDGAGAGPDGAADGVADGAGAASRLDGKPAVDGAADAAAAERERRIAQAQKLYAELLAQAKAETEPEHQKVVELGGLHIIGTERHEARRIDNQLRGRSGRQGDPGSSRFYVSLEDDLMRLFASDWVRRFMDRLGWEEDVPIENMQLTRAIENAQKKVEARNFEIRRQVLAYDDVMNRQREVIYEQRRRVLTGQDLRESILDMAARLVDGLLATYADEKVHPEDWDLPQLCERVNDIVNRPGAVQVAALEGLKRPELRERLVSVIQDAYARREQQLGAEAMRQLERVVLLRVIDSKWTEHLRAMDDLREGIGLRAYGQRDPLVEYKLEAFNMFNAMVTSIQEDALRYLFRVQLVSPAEQEEMARRRLREVSLNRSEDGNGGAGRRGGARRQAQARSRIAQVASQGAAADGAAAGPAEGREPEGPVVVQRRVAVKIGRNDPCPCGSGKKYKHCHGRNQ
ncbi:MAG: preprotein translocase subunit SecA [Limnochordaceae bacterium]|nr:preprotein translocase subunit SecA [Limnochordaceae bacterium]